jgi:hypothetical protein
VLERRILPQDRLVEIAELLARLDAELLHQRAPGRRVGVESLGLAARSVEGQHQLAAKPLTHRVPLDQLLKLADHREVLTPCKRVVDGELARSCPELLQAADLGRRERLVGEIVERRTAPQHECLADRVAGRPLSRGHQPLEAQRVDRVRGRAQLVAAAAGQDLRHVAAEQLAQLRDVELHHLRCARRRLLAPQPLDQAIGRDRRVGPQRQHRQHRALLGGAQRDGPSVDAGLDQSEEPDFHARPYPHAGAGRNAEPFLYRP